MPADFYLLEETLAIIKAIEKNLELHKLDPARHLNLSDAETRKHVQALIPCSLQRNATRACSSS
jgi:hypothetical protein